VQIQDFRQIIEEEKNVESINEEKGKEILSIIEKEFPQMHRIYSWQKKMIDHLKRKSSQTVEVNSIEYEVMHFPSWIFAKHLKNGKVANNLSRKDPRFNTSKERAFIDMGNNVTFYLE
jgi:hypothetical protein